MGAGVRIVALTPMPSPSPSPLPSPPSGRSQTAVAARLAVYGPTGEPPAVEELTPTTRPSWSSRSATPWPSAPLPAPAVREVSRTWSTPGSATRVSVLGGGAVLRVADHRPGIADPAAGSASRPRDRGAAIW